MDNLSKIKLISKIAHLLFSFILLVAPVYYFLYWVFINDLPNTLITVNNHSAPLIQNILSIKIQITGYIISLLPLSALIYMLLNIRKLFSLYKDGVIFSFEHVRIFQKTAKFLFLWVILSILYESAKSVLFSLGNPPGSRVIEVGVSSEEITTFLLAGLIFIIAWVMDEGRILNEDNKLTI